MTTVGQYLRSSMSFSKKDLGILSSLFLLTFVASFVFLWHNGIYLQRLHVTMQVLGVIICILLGLNVSFFVYRLLSDPEKLLPMLHSLHCDGVLRKTVTELVLLNLLALTNFAFLTFSYVLDSQTVQITAVSMSVGTWPLFFLILMNMDGRFYVASTDPTICPVPQSQNLGGMPIAVSCGPAVVPANPKPNLDDRVEDHKLGATAC